MSDADAEYVMPFADAADPLPGEVVPYIPTPDSTVARMLALAGPLGPADHLLDLGCGDGRIAVAAALAHGCRASGVDISPELVGRARALAERSGVGHLTSFSVADFLDPQFDLRGASVVTCYIVPNVLKLLEARLARHVSEVAGARVVTSVFRFARWVPAREDAAMKLWLYDATSELSQKRIIAHDDDGCAPAF
eukprot:m51a1_g1594 hypothetical protein (194) ;mRNA; r:154959-155540